MIKLSGVFLRKLISLSLKEGKDIEDTIKLTRNRTSNSYNDLPSSFGLEDDDFSLSWGDFDDDLVPDFEFDEEGNTKEITQVKDPERTQFARGTPPKYRSHLYDQDHSKTATHSDPPYSPTAGDFEPFIEDFYDPPEPPPVFHKEENEETYFGGKRDQEFDDSGLADYLKSIGDSRDTIQFRKDLVDKIDKLKQDLREGNLRGQDRLSKIIELSIFENIYRQTLRG